MIRADNSQTPASPKHLRAMVVSLVFLAGGCSGGNSAPIAPSSSFSGGQQIAQAYKQSQALEKSKLTASLPTPPSTTYAGGLRVVQSAKSLLSSPATLTAKLPNPAPKGDYEVVVASTGWGALTPPSGWTCPEDDYNQANWLVCYIVSTGSGTQSASVATYATGTAIILDISGSSGVTVGSAVETSSTSISPTLRIPSAGGLLIPIEAAYIASGSTVMTNTPPSGQTVVTVQNGGTTTTEGVLSVQESTNEPYNASQPYTDKLSTANTSSLSGTLLWFAPSGVSPSPSSSSRASPLPSVSPSTMPKPSPTPTSSKLSYNLPLNPNPMARRACADPCSPPLDPNSSSWISKFFSGGLGSWLVPASSPDTGPGDNVFYTDSTNPSLTNSHAHRVTCVEFGGCGSRTIYIPDGAFAANSAGDWHMSIIDRSTGIEWGFWEMNESCAGCGGNGSAISGTGPVTNGYLGECDTGAFPLGGTTNNCQSDTGQSYQGSNIAIGVPASVGNVNPIEWASGNIPHALWIVSTCTQGQGSNYEYPAAGSDGNQAGCPVEGARLWLDLTDAQINALGDPPWATTMLHNLHDYGWVLSDTAGSGGPIIDFDQLGAGTWTFNGGTDPWPAFYSAQSSFSNSIPTNGLAGHLHFVDPCISEGSC